MTSQLGVLNVNAARYDRILLEVPGAGSLGQAFLETEGDMPDPDADCFLILESSLTHEEGYGPDATDKQSWQVLPGYQYSRVLTRLQGTINFSDGGTAATGSGTAFTTQLKVGEEFQTADENIIAEDSGGNVIFESDERLQHEDITINDIKDVQLSAEELGIAIEDFRWFISSEDSDLGAHSSHAGVIGNYVYSPTAESYWILTHDSNGLLGVGQEDDGGGIVRETPEWENNNMLWEDMSKMLITDPQAFMVGAITNDTSLTVTRKHLGGVTDSIYQM